MDLTLNTINHHDYIYIGSKGVSVNNVELKYYTKRVFDAIVESGFKKAILDEREFAPLTDVLSQVELSEFLNDKSLFPNIREYKLAVIYNARSKSALEFWELYSKNRGLNFKVFEAVNEAKEWILEK